MRRHTLRGSSLIVATWLILVLGCAPPEPAAVTEAWLESADPDSGVALVLTPEQQVITRGQLASLTATLVNRGKRAVVLVEPGDGSNYGWRTPLIEWSRRRRDPIPRCGNVNALQQEEVFTLEPGGSRVLGPWLTQPYVASPGQYRIALRYINEPERRWEGLPLKKHDAAAMQAVRSSTPVSIVSNTVEIVVEE